ncbi:calcitonin gene-related peptide type 1 receptor-like isoform X2 [Physella acuta]|uniref:calcitonin gene-related peptide type 1 receptor-like isoform X2 n=1 Tax=Physella acuta TaxID=109671 RepID=UPI0027DE0C90|nr:calcitonin gene-related peptide type 1 receptor-like isoform X2 [Physella acuta]
MGRLGMCSIFTCLFLLQVFETFAQKNFCRSKFGNFTQEVFNLHACAKCYFYITQSRSVRIHPTQPILVVLGTNQTAFKKYDILIPNAANDTQADLVCRTTTADNCLSWKKCCQEASSCCQRHLDSPPRPEGTCPRTWDGYGCWDDTWAGSTAYISCPGFLKYSITSRYAEKTCTENGTWLVVGNNSWDQSYEWSDYTKCLDKHSRMVSLYLALSCNIASIGLLVPAIGIFLLYRSLRRQHRIRLHINFFGALLLHGLVAILWDVFVAHDRLMTSDSSASVIFQNGDACKFLAYLRIYSRSATYVWMFCEGFYLHRLISNAFKPPKSLVFLYTIGWGCPLAYTTLYAALRIIYANESCWAKPYGELQWIFFAPNLSCLIVNFFFLCNILRILVTQLQSHPNEPSNFRRALKATFVLIPLFGVQLFVTLYRPPAGQSGGLEYEQFSAFMLNSQGFFVALIFCFFNGEVLRKCCPKRHRRYSHQFQDFSLQSLT